MNKTVNTYWTDSRLVAQRPASRGLTMPTSAVELSRELVGTRAEMYRRGGMVPSWMIFTSIMLATFALCMTVTMRTNAQMRSAGQRYAEATAQVETLRNTNESLRREVERVHRDPRAIEAAARTRLNMVRANEIVVPVE